MGEITRLGVELKRCLRYNYYDTDFLAMGGYYEEIIYIRISYRGTSR